MNFKETVKMSQLPNGLTILTDTIPNSKILYASVNIMTGGQHDPKDKLGLAHLSEHFAMYGVPGISGDKLRDITYDIGLKEPNFMTNSSGTFYYGDVTGDLPTGEMIQKRNFDESIKSNAQIVKKFTPV